MWHHIRVSYFFCLLHNPATCGILARCTPLAFHGAHDVFCSMCKNMPMMDSTPGIALARTGRTPLSKSCCFSTSKLRRTFFLPPFAPCMVTKAAKTARLRLQTDIYRENITYIHHGPVSPPRSRLKRMDVQCIYIRQRVSCARMPVKVSWKLRNPEKVRAQLKRYYQKNKDHIQQQSRDWKLKNTTKRYKQRVCEKERYHDRHNPY